MGEERGACDKTGALNLCSPFSVCRKFSRISSRWGRGLLGLGEWKERGKGRMRGGAPRWGEGSSLTPFCPCCLASLRMTSGRRASEWQQGSWLLLAAPWSLPTPRTQDPPWLKQALRDTAASGCSSLAPSSSDGSIMAQVWSTEAALSLGLLVFGCPRGSSQPTSSCPFKIS